MHPKKLRIRQGEEGADNIDLKGKTVVITGANSGIGKELSTYAAAKGAKLYMLCRSKERAENARSEVVKLTNNENVEIMLVSIYDRKHENYFWYQFCSFFFLAIYIFKPSQLIDVRLSESW